ncbi:nucleotidyltransferase family protein [Sciscionella sediminilitoris]|uniref:nucleotidyltransferase family protein n=1 Tax=Sciscionella sediminilitoris TaxID=1445613 RepID=UPI000563C50A|nr:nucleotidyltransferase family protein [Sciscionella sp. SE31]
MTEKPQVVGLLLAAGAGTRFGGPKALAEVGGEPLVLRAIRTLRDGGCAEVLVVLGAAASKVHALLPPEVRSVYAPDWETGMGASLRTGLAAVPDWASAVLVHLVDLPGVTAQTVREVGALATRSVLARAGYQGKPGHPVLIGADHLAELGATLHGAHGAKTWLRERTVHLVECARFGHGEDLDTPEDGVRLGLWSAPP